MPRVAYVTFSRVPGLCSDGELLQQALAASAPEIELVPCVWDDATVDWSQYDVVLLRTCWDYHLKSAAFREWIERVPLLVNPASVVRWNMDKSVYLRELAAQGVPVVPTVWVSQGDIPPRVTDVMSERGWERVVIKPTVSANAYLTRTFSADQVAEAQGWLESGLQHSSLLLQPFLTSIRDGEYSLIFFHHQFSHAVLKIPKAGDFRVQPEYDSTTMSIEPEPRLLHLANQILSLVPSVCLYARVDLILHNNEACLMELELIEPNLFLSFEQDAPARFAAAVALHATVQCHK
eukprot:TRINITY_DN1027_c0_g2_i1.p1 TRINITY_DN1027_c0_g2~~TRINITY_DN1027_c0_g2_i1.p1  ORF type:complete len:292 (-),score=34.22 TRINITY_DN1027_c0_g2_i1:92-967(-)